MSCTYYLRDRKITKKIIKELDLLEKEFNLKLNNLYEELNNKVANILPINNEIAGDFRFCNFVDLNHFIRFYEENKSKYIIIDEYNTEFTLDEFLKEINFK